MLKLFRYLKKAYVPVIAIVLLLILQASCDLTLPTFTSNIVNVGIQQKGIEDAVPDVMREETFLALKSLMKQDDADDMEDAYKLYTKDQVKDSKYKDYKDGRLYVRRYISKKDREHLDTSMSKAMLKLSAQMAKQIQANPQAAASLSKSQKKMMAQMKNMDTKDMPDTIISQAAISFVTSEYKAIGLDIDQMQTHYLLVTGAKMIGLAFLIMAAAVSVTLLSERQAVGFPHGEVVVFGEDDVVPQAYLDQPQRTDDVLGGGEVFAGGQRHTVGVVVCLLIGIFKHPGIRSLMQPEFDQIFLRSLFLHTFIICFIYQEALGRCHHGIHLGIADKPGDRKFLTIHKRRNHVGYVSIEKFL